MVLEQQAELRDAQVTRNLLAAMQAAATALGPPPGIAPTSSPPPELSNWQDVRELVVYGLGSVEDSKVSRHVAAAWYLFSA